jgi:hypothetical protein
MNNLPFARPGRFWKGNLHTHSTASDGDNTPEEVCRRYRQAGYDFLALTDHFMPQYNFPVVDTRPFRTADFTTLIGAELHTRAVRTEMGSVWHILAVGLPFDFAHVEPDETAAQLTQRALDAGAYVAVAHPNWYALSERDMASLPQTHAIEIINGVAIDYNDRGDSWHFADVQLGRGERYTICATDDFHGKPERADFQRGWVQVKSNSNEPEALLEALKAGHSCSSTGPEIYDIHLEAGNKVTVRSSPADRVFVTGKGPVSSYVGGHGATQWELSLKRFDSPYCRITVRDRNGGRAWSNPIWF